MLWRNGTHIIDCMLWCVALIHKLLPFTVLSLYLHCLSLPFNCRRLAVCSGLCIGRQTGTCREGTKCDTNTRVRCSIAQQGVHKQRVHRRAAEVAQESTFVSGSFQRFAERRFADSKPEWVTGDFEEGFDDYDRYGQRGKDSAQDFDVILAFVSTI